ncbi:hypothetical protein ACSQ67_014213 [Phaseolus vulgaris]
MMTPVYFVNVQLPILWRYNKMSLLNLVASLVKTGVHGRIYSSGDGRPLPGSITVSGINYTVTAGKTFGDYHRFLAPRDKYEVVATMPGYKSKNTTIWLDDGPVTLDFVLDPEVSVKGSVLQNACDCDCPKGLILSSPFQARHQFRNEAEEEEAEQKL